MYRHVLNLPSTAARKLKENKAARSISQHRHAALYRNSYIITADLRVMSDPPQCRAAALRKIKIKTLLRCNQIQTKQLATNRVHFNKKKKKNESPWAVTSRAIRLCYTDGAFQEN